MLLLHVTLCMLGLALPATAFPPWLPPGPPNLRINSSWDNKPAGYGCHTDAICQEDDNHLMPWNHKMEQLCDYVANYRLDRSDIALYSPGETPRLPWGNGPYYADQNASTRAPPPNKQPCAQYWSKGAVMSVRWTSDDILHHDEQLCIRTGNEMWWDYQDMKKFGCESCGWKSWGPDLQCRTLMTYMKKKDCKHHFDGI